MRGLRAGSGTACRGSVSGRGAVRAPLPGSVMRCRTTISGTYPPPGRRTSSSAPPRRPPSGPPSTTPDRTDGTSRTDRGRTAPQINGASAATAAAVAATRSDTSGGTACHAAPAAEASCAPICTRCSAASARRCSDDGSGSARGAATDDGSWSRWIRRRQCVVADASSTTSTGPAPGARAGTGFAVAVTVPRVVTTPDSSGAASSGAAPSTRTVVDGQRSGVISSCAPARTLSWRPGRAGCVRGSVPEHPGFARRSG